MSAIPKLFTPITLGGKSPIVLKHRVAMAPLTRLKTGDDGVQPEIAVKYYEQRATDGGLIIAEATNISPQGRGCFGAPGIFNQAQIEAWKPVVDAVHAKGGKFFLQLWHTGRMSHPSLHENNALPVSSSSNMPLSDSRVLPTKDGVQAIVQPRALETEEIPAIVQDYRIATENAIAAGFDGVEVHAANGYLIEQFISDGINDRTDKYGGSIENRARFLFEVLDEVLKTTPSSKVGVRFSPYHITAGQRQSDPAATYNYIFDKLNAYDLAYAHIVEPRGFHYENDKAPKEGSTAQFRKVYKGVFMTASGYERDSSVEVVENDTADIVAIGRFFISNPDLVKRFELNAELTPFERETFYGAHLGEKGYTDYPFLGEAKQEEKTDEQP
ncbi:hypothetical protein Poli38472_007939 [Pythium oligandrum]|uniref:NADH:flavin oxidoreductase/NADH oxidase N-terminal domain-containing protein n=1 Tax=Pythium oligandrum TaxID=41045 RepID=A0A8K1FMX7_PYTOL|nr:hypothetical protein Poli38472_007939 [Pythium oligandrum]|eukprot:TMW65297.1 hypothetical protein Poli38472_007939 [Pythium oligandrum]